MHVRLLLPLFALAILLSACSSTVVTDEERRLPDGEAMEKMEDGTVSREVYLSQSYIAFTGKNSKSTQEGKFTEFTVDLEEEGDVLTGLAVVIDVSSMVTGSQKLTDHLLNPDFFEVETWPEIVFESTSIEAVEDSYTVTGTLEMHGETGEVSFDLMLTNEYITAEFTVSRDAYGIGEPYDGSMMSIEDEIPMEVKVVFK